MRNPCSRKEMPGCAGCQTHEEDAPRCYIYQYRRAEDFQTALTAANADAWRLNGELWALRAHWGCGCAEEPAAAHAARLAEERTP